mmetsp:Transcript_4273/g.14158  ORF Transcript_4273/g.14158 Transcript_4273/m.14158 type:complete len:206 (+) Transcript_4273:339-956(+)
MSLTSPGDRSCRRDISLCRERERRGGSDRIFPKEREVRCHRAESRHSRGGGEGGGGEGDYGSYGTCPSPEPSRAEPSRTADYAAAAAVLAAFVRSFFLSPKTTTLKRYEVGLNHFEGRVEGHVPHVDLRFGLLRGDVRRRRVFGFLRACEARRVPLTHPEGRKTHVPPGAGGRRSPARSWTSPPAEFRRRVDRSIVRTSAAASVE